MRTGVVGAAVERSALADLEGSHQHSSLSHHANWLLRFTGMKIEVLGFQSKTDKFQFRKL